MVGESLERPNAARATAGWSGKPLLAAFEWNPPFGRSILTQGVFLRSTAPSRA